MAVQLQHAESPFEWRVRRAVHPAALYWPNVGRLSVLQQRAAAALTQAATLAVCGAFLPLIAVVQSLSTIANLAKACACLARRV